MKILMLNGSPREGGNTARALAEMEKIFLENGCEVETVQIGAKTVRGCLACLSCRKTGKCAVDDGVNEIADKFREADALVVGSPVHYASADPMLMALLDRLFYSSTFDKTMKVGAAVAVARRSGLTATVDELHKFFSISGMPIATSYYWNNLHGAAPLECERDEEGMAVVRGLARNVVFLVKSIALGNEAFGLPEREANVKTNFIR